MTENQIKAIRGMLACKFSRTDAIEAGIDACRSDTYKQALQKFNAERNACLDYYKRKEMKPPRAERVKGATELRDWLAGEYDRITILRQKRARLADKPVASTLRERCMKRIQRAVTAAYQQCNYRVSDSHWAGGNHTLKVIAGSPVEAAHGYSERVWSSNGKWSGTNSTHKITVMSSWYNRVYSKGIACVDGLLTIDAEAQHAEPLKAGEKAYLARWVVQGRGVTLHSEEGILYRRHGGVWIHGTSVKNARSLNNKRLKALVADRIAARQRKLEAEEEMRKLEGILVTREDCTAAGLCDAGQRDWLCKRGLDENTQAVPAKKLLEMAIVAQDRVHYVRQAIRLAVSKPVGMAA